ncbi:MAG: hypothetical protein GX974_02640 [Clostridiales bacterium]|nr:hypothetical protein [Clostridiales bacterium]
MNWVERLKNSFRRFMMGRYGSDQLAIALLIIYGVIALVMQFAHSIVLIILQFVLLVIIIYRIFSKDIAKRHRENIKFLNLWYPIQRKFQTRIRRIRDRKHYRYYKCPECKQTLRVPKGKGKISITCPKCKNVIIRKS